MKISKLDGIKIMEYLKIPTVSRVDISKIINDEFFPSNGISIRTSSKSNTYNWNVYLPSIHNCNDLDIIKKFIEKNSQYNIIAHETVRPDIIGSISKLYFSNYIIIELFRNFNDRKNEIVKNRMIIPFFCDRIWVSLSEFFLEDPDDLKSFKKVIIYLKSIPFHYYDIEFVIQNGDVIFTDLTIPDGIEQSLYYSIKKYIQ